ncbi:hypothetical protein EJ07DRAFT_154969 [Lizonia empirigonia]|nr:hypothetical protein EJ07DRAFT_154969 [Lizonia empirigonia]
MGDIISPANSNNIKQPGIMIVRPSLHSHTPSNAATFKRWTIMHFRDLLNLAPKTANAQGISRTMRYTNDKGSLFYTIHADDVAVWQTPAYYNVSRRLDLESTRGVERGEEAVISAPIDAGLGEEPMVWQLVNAEFGIFKEQPPSHLEQKKHDSYHSIPLACFSARSETPAAPACLLVALTCASDAPGKDADEPQRLLDGLVDCLAVHYASAANIYASLYRYAPGAQPHMHPTIAEGREGNGQWVGCAVVETGSDEAGRARLTRELENWSVKRKAREDTEGRGEQWDVKVGVWSGEVFMS